MAQLDWVSKRVNRDYKEFIRSPVDNVIVNRFEDNIKEWHFVIRGPNDSPFSGGLYHGKLVFPEEYRFKAPVIYMFTPNGKFQCNTPFFLTVRELWTTDCSAITVFNVLNQFFNDSNCGHFTGSDMQSIYRQKKLAQSSWSFNLKDRLFCELFPQLVEESKSRDLLTTSDITINPELSANDSISLGLIGTQLKLRQVLSDGTESDIKLINGSEDNVFIGLFPVEDVDFEIVVDNSSGDKNIIYGIKIANIEQKSFVIKKANIQSIKSLKTKGKHLRFVSQKTPNAKLMVEMSANNNRLTLAEASILCSRIEFEIKVERDLDEIIVPKVYKTLKDYRVFGQKININIETLSRKPIELLIGVNNSVEDLKILIQEKRGIPVDQQKIIYGGNQLYDDMTLTDYRIKDKSTLHLVLRLRGGGPPVPTERGVICFGRKTTQTIGEYLDLIPSEKYIIKPFAIELRVYSNVTPVETGFEIKFD